MPLYCPHEPPDFSLTFGETIFVTARRAIHELTVIGYDSLTKRILVRTNDGVRMSIKQGTVAYADRETAEQFLKERKKRK